MEWRASRAGPLPPSYTTPWDASDPPVIANSEQRNTLQVRERFGADQIIAVSATLRQVELEQAIRQLDPQRDPLKIPELAERYGGAGVWVGLTGLSGAP